MTIPRGAGDRNREAFGGRRRSGLVLLRRALVLLLAVLLLALVPAGIPAQGAAEPEVRIVRLMESVELPTATSLVDHVGNAPLNGGGIGPGMRLFMQRDSEPRILYVCTANFVFTDSAKTYLGAAGHCFLPENRTATHGPGADYDASEVHVSVCTSGCEFGGQSGFILPGHMEPLGRVAYARQSAADGAIGNDFGLVEVPAAALAFLRPAEPVWGGPTSTAAPKAGDVACHYGNGVYFGETLATKARVGELATYGAKSWQANVAINGGDSGSAMLTCVADASGLHGVKAVGIVTHGQVIGGLPDGVGYGTTLPRAVQMAQEAGLHVQVVLAAP